MIALLWALCAGSTAQATDAYLAGGVVSTPTGQEGLAAWRLGVATERLVPWMSFGMARLSLPEEQISISLYQPQMGLRVAFADHEPQSARAFLGLSAYTRLGGLKDNKIGQEELTIRLPIGGTIGGGLEAILTQHASLSAEFGLNGFTAGVVESGWVTQVNKLGTHAALTVELFL
jgi:hypothetical protein